MVNKIVDFAANETGRLTKNPFGFIRTLRSLRPPSFPNYRGTASYTSVIPWHLWAQQHDEEGIHWRLASQQFHATSGHIGQLARLCLAEHSHRVIDIRDIRAASCSKSDLSEYGTLHKLATGTGKDVLNKYPRVEASIAEFMKWHEIRLSSEHDPDAVHDYRWSGAYGLVLFNNGGSHHLAAAIHLAHQFQASHTVLAKYITYYLDTLSALELQQEVGLMFMPEDPQDEERLVQAVEFFGADYGKMYLRGWPENDEIPILALPLASRRSAIIWHAIQKESWPTLNMLLAQSIEQTRRNDAPRRAVR